MYQTQDNSKLRALLSHIGQKREAWKAKRSQQEWKAYVAPTNKITGGEVVRDTPEVQRILDLPRKREAAEDLVWLAREMTDILKTPNGQMSLRPLQAEALRDLSEGRHEGKFRGIFSPARVGSGKTLISLLSATVLDAQRPLLIVPAKLMEKTKRDAMQLCKHWIILSRIRVQSYEKMSRVSGEHFLREMQPDLIIADEAHKLKNRNAAVTRRVMRYMEEQPSTVFVALSGTITKRSVNDYAHILKWTHKDDRPVPVTYSEVESWALALDVINRSQSKRNGPGALLRFCNKEELDIAAAEPKEGPLIAIRKGYQRRLSETHGVVITPSSDIDASLSIQELRIEDDNADIQAAFRSLRLDWMRPDGVDFSDPVELYRAAKQLALGFYYRWNPKPPEEWMKARKEWNRLVRKVLSSHTEGLDSPLMIANAIREGHLAGMFKTMNEGDENGEATGPLVPMIDILNNWKTIEKTFIPKTEVVWMSDHVLKVIHQWTKKHNGIVWVEHVELGKKLESKYGLSYYGQQGKDGRKRFIDDHPKGTPFVASIGSNSEGRNLQSWNENLITSVMPNALQWEQLIGRTHRDGQEADEVSFDVLMGCVEHAKHFEQSIEDAKYQLGTLGQPQKLLLADTTMTSSEWFTRIARNSDKSDIDFRFYQAPRTPDQEEE